MLWYAEKKGASVRFLVWLFGVVTIFTIHGCAVGPDYVPPETPTRQMWHTELRGGLTAEPMDPETLASWWKTLNDPTLSTLIHRAVSHNLGLKNARARVREARARRGVTQADLFPTLDTGGSATWSRGSEETGNGKTRDFYAAGFDAAWELDLFGGRRRSVEAAEADLRASQENLRDVLVSLLGEVALNYVEVRTYQTRLTVAKANLAAQNDTYELTQHRYQAGLSDELAVHQARYNLEQTRSQIPNLRTGLEEAQNRLAVLVGEQPGAVHAELAEGQPIPVTPLKIAVGVPAEAVRRRPDVRQAERDLAAQTARVGAAMADFYPKFTLNGSIGLEALSLAKLFSAQSDTFSLGPRITWPIFDAGSIHQNIEVQSALQEQALIQYEAAVLSSLEEVENALVAYAEEQSRRNTLRKGAEAAQQAVVLSQYKYEAGLMDFGDVLDAQRSLLSFQDQLAQSEGAVTSNLIALYKALGGGWTSLAPDDEE
jgi:NodT family efflux transporter outer membrane factor (OMF) lipoprotein